MDMSKYREMFLSETREHLDSMARLLVALEKAPADQEGIDSLFRDAHSVKGMAASMGYQGMADLSHSMEDMLDRFRSGGEVPASAVDRLLAGCDLLEGLLEDIAAERPERDISDYLQYAPGDEAEIPVAEELPEEVICDLVEDASLNLLELTVDIADHAMAPAARAMLVLRELERHGDILETWPTRSDLLLGGPVKHLRVQLQTSQAAAQIEATLLSMSDLAGVRWGGEAEQDGLPRRRREDSDRTVRIKTDLLDRFINLTGELITTRTMLQSAQKHKRWDEIDAGLDQLSLLLSNLHHKVLQVRMMPVSSITGRLPRMVRDIARRTGKEIDLQISGEEVELDRSILEELADPLIHLLRNAVDHGIEQKGVVAVRAWREKDLVLVEVADNGRGIDPDKIRSKALALGLITTSQAGALSDRDVFGLICHPGFSTADEVTETSGRGVGMDVVKASVENLGGILDVISAPGEGTRMLLRLPLSVAIIQILLVECAGQQVALPITRVYRTLEVPREQLQSSGKQLVLHLEDDVVPLLSLRKILNLPNTPFAGSVPLVITEVRGRRVGLVVDRLVGQREVFVKSLSFPLDRLAGVTGASVLGDGQVVFVIDPQGLLDAGTPVVGQAA
jgi:two-component system chemotaxis sensor kinase CheA